MRLIERRTPLGLDDSVRPLVAVWTLGVLALVVVRFQHVASPEELFLDPSYYTGTAWYTGMLSSIGILGWSVAASGCAATSFVAGVGGRVGAAGAFRLGALVLSMHLFDDLFLFHSGLLPTLTGLPKPIWTITLLTMTTLWLRGAMDEIRRTRWGLIVAGGTMLAASVFVDTLELLEIGGGEWVVLAEDGPKFLGILALAAWSVMSAADVIRSVVAEAAASSVPVPQAEAVPADK